MGATSPVANTVALHSLIGMRPLKASVCGEEQRLRVSVCDTQAPCSLDWTTLYKFV